MGLGLVAAVLAMAPAGWQASGASLKSSVTKDGRIVISISGEITPGDTDAFKAAVKTANDAGKLVSSIRLNSPGGNLLEGAKLADAVRFGKMATNVGQGASCASACFLVFAAGETKFANYTAQIGVHGASDESGAETVQSGAATVSMARIAKELGVPPQIIGRMVVTPPSDMVWLSPQDLMSMGVSMVGKPSQIPSVANTVPEQTAPGEPIQITPQAKASTEPQMTWNDLVKRAIKLSSDQNNGNPLFSRFCQPEEKVCIIGLSYTQNDGKLGFLKSVENPDGKIVMREICTINEFKDVRTCVNWDTGASHRDMKDAKGEWYKVADE
jgi:hypothetical protein